MTNHSQIKNLVERGFRIIPIPHKSKAAKINNWPNLKVDTDNFEKYFPSNKEMNVGVMNGKKSGNIVDIDIDDLGALELSEYYLPKTNMIFGRKSNPKSHWIYKCESLPKTQKFQTKSCGVVIEIRANGTQTIFPPSTHESGEAIQFVEDGKPTSVKKEELEKACTVITVGTILLKYYAEDGHRNDFALPVSSVALRLFEGDVAQAKRFVKIIAQLSGDDEAEQRALIVEHTNKKIQNGDLVQGIPSLKEFMPQDAVDDIAKLVLDTQKADRNNIVSELNKTYAVVTTPPTVSIIKETVHGFDILNINAFRAELTPLRAGDKSYSQIWLNSLQRRSYEGIEFKPAHPSNNKFNTFRGFKAPIRKWWP